jgi:CHAD domain-containing protein
MHSRLADATDVMLRSWRRAHRRLVDRGLRRGAVHEWRVTTRRLLAMTSLLASGGRPRAVKCVEREVRAAFKASGRLRDSQVALDLLRALEPAPALARPFGIWLRARVPKLRHRVAKRVGALDAKAVVRQVRKLRESTAANEQQALASALARLAAARRDLAREGENVTDRSTADALHQLRVEMKQLRYEAEFLAPWLDAHGSDALLRQLPPWQRMLGEIADRSVLLAALERFVEEHPGYRGGAEAMRISIRRDQRRFIARFAQHWRLFHRLDVAVSTAVDPAST